MEKFMLLVRQDLREVGQMTEEEYLVKLNLMLGWVDELAAGGNYVAAEPLLTTGRYVTDTKVLSDGPFIEAKEAISGYFIVWAENIDHAVRLSQMCPLLHTKEVVIEVRPIRVLEN
ncbi:YciI family protein [Dyadobacter sp. 32]|uniref:YciI family protein n=1 Tax=Dyadobacter sp. 32 TaxID=538966 RepID=UPI0039C69A57